jgi:hypothetical protein
VATGTTLLARSDRGRAPDDEACKGNRINLIQVKPENLTVGLTVVFMGKAKMVVNDSRDFLFNSRHLSVRAAAFGEGWRVRVFEGDRAVTSVVYSVTHENTADASIASMHLVNELMTLAQDDVEEGRVRLIT